MANLKRIIQRLISWLESKLRVLATFIDEKTPPKVKSFLKKLGHFLKKVIRKIRSLGMPAIITLCVGGFLILAIGAFLTYRYFVADLATPEKLMNKNNTGMILMDRNGKSFFKEEGARDIKVYPIEKMPDYVKEAFIAIEDENFYTHPGFSIRGIARAFVTNISDKQYAQGGSTITQQLVKNALLTSQKTFTRKYQELVLSIEIERIYSKDEILEMYLNSIYFGSGAYGIEDAAQTYFGKDVAQLDVGEAAILAALPKSPSSLSPFGGNRERLFARQALILKQMGKDPKKYADVEFVEEDDAQTSSLAPHFAVWVRQYLYDKYGEDVVNRQGFRVTTTIDSTMQKTGETLVKQHIKNLGRRDASNAALVAINPKTGEILTMVGSVDWANEEFGKFNVAFAKRQPGSTFKPIVYALAFEDGKNPSDIVKDEQTDFGGYIPRNSDGTFRGDVTIRQALANSLNIPAVKMLEFVGVKTAIRQARDMGMISLDPNRNYGLSLVLGGGEVQLFEITRAFGVFATEGELVSSHPILLIEDKYGNEVYRYSPNRKKEENSDKFKYEEPYEKDLIGGIISKNVLKDTAAFFINSILSDNETRKDVFGEQNSLQIADRQVAAKTGTTNDFKDAWTIGYTPDLVAGVWVGNNDNSPMKGLYGSVAAAPIWNGFMRQALSGSSFSEFKRPKDIIEVKMCKETKTYCASCLDEDTYIELYDKDFPPEEKCDAITPTPEEEKNEENKEEPTETPTQKPTSKPTATPTTKPKSTNTPVPTVPTNSPTPTVITQPDATDTPTPIVPSDPPTATLSPEPSTIEGI